jgi:hypothetical protein
MPKIQILHQWVGSNLLSVSNEQNQKKLRLPFVGYQLPTNLFKLLLPSYSHLKYLCYMHIFLEL